jgi:predicted RNA-binding protein
MCLSSVYMDTREGRKEIMRDVARIEAEGSGFWLIDLFGKKRFAEGVIRTIDLLDGHFVILDATPKLHKKAGPGNGERRIHRYRPKPVSSG